MYIAYLLGMRSYFFSVQLNQHGIGNCYLFSVKTISWRLVLAGIYIAPVSGNCSSTLFSFSPCQSSYYECFGCLVTLFGVFSQVIFRLWTSWLIPRSLTSLGVRIGVYLTGLDFIQFFLLLALCMGNGVVSLSGWCKADLHFAHIFSVGIRFMVDLLYLFFVVEVKAPKGDRKSVV